MIQRLTLPRYQKLACTYSIHAFVELVMIWATAFGYLTGPFWIVLACNTAFGLSIPFNIWTWLLFMVPLLATDLLRVYGLREYVPWKTKEKKTCSEEDEDEEKGWL